ncbi:unnamed protein product [Moneuplotes crassus]|uniref:Uncharacterized protein n=1 Tax=Euplotes crassus TaxID=5936 RepID=A0AAD1Y2N2_EUPCR|nr:unnamed protein product [Moneuplotes crassus]
MKKKFKKTEEQIMKDMQFIGIQEEHSSEEKFEHIVECFMSSPCEDKVAVCIRILCMFSFINKQLHSKSDTEEYSDKILIKLLPKFTEILEFSPAYLKYDTLTLLSYCTGRRESEFPIMFHTLLSKGDFLQSLIGLLRSELDLINVKMIQRVLRIITNLATDKDIINLLLSLDILEELPIPTEEMSLITEVRKEIAKSNIEIMELVTNNLDKKHIPQVIKTFPDILKSVGREFGEENDKIPNSDFEVEMRLIVAKIVNRVTSLCDTFIDLIFHHFTNVEETVISWMEDEVGCIAFQGISVAGNLSAYQGEIKDLGLRLVTNGLLNSISRFFRSDKLEKQYESYFTLSNVICESFEAAKSVINNQEILDMLLELLGTVSNEVALKELTSLICNILKNICENKYEWHKKCIRYLYENNLIGKYKEILEIPGLSLRCKCMTLYGLKLLFDLKKNMNQEYNFYAKAFIEIQGNELLEDLYNEEKNEGIKILMKVIIEDYFIKSCLESD